MSRQVHRRSEKAEHAKAASADLAAADCRGTCAWRRASATTRALSSSSAFFFSAEATSARLRLSSNCAWRSSCSRERE